MAYEINKVWLDNSIHVPLSVLPYALQHNQVKYNARSMMRQGVWPNDFLDYIDMFDGDEIALYNSIVPTPHSWRSMGGPPTKLADGKYSWYPSKPPMRTPQSQDVSAFVQAAMQPSSTTYVDTHRSAFRDFSAWIITRNYETEASTSNEVRAAFKPLHQPNKQR